MNNHTSAKETTNEKVFTTIEGFNKSNSLAVEKIQAPNHMVSAIFSGLFVGILLVMT